MKVLILILLGIACQLVAAFGGWMPQWQGYVQNVVPQQWQGYIPQQFWGYPGYGVQQRPPVMVPTVPASPAYATQQQPMMAPPGYYTNPSQPVVQQPPSPSYQQGQWPQAPYSSDYANSAGGYVDGVTNSVGNRLAQSQATASKAMDNAQNNVSSSLTRATDNASKRADAALSSAENQAGKLGEAALSSVEKGGLSAFEKAMQGFTKALS